MPTLPPCKTLLKGTICFAALSMCGLQEHEIMFYCLFKKKGRQGPEDDPKTRILPEFYSFFKIFSFLFYSMFGDFWGLEKYQTDF